MFKIQAIPLAKIILLHIANYLLAICNKIFYGKITPVFILGYGDKYLNKDHPNAFGYYRQRIN